jgi:GTP pyrophosphokinase
MNKQKFFDILQEIHPPENLELIKSTVDFAQDIYNNDQRNNGQSVLDHCFYTALLLAEMHLSDVMIQAAILHELPKYKDDYEVLITKKFGTELAGLIHSAYQLGKVRYRGLDKYVENLRNMFMSTALDIRVILVRFADRIHNLMTLSGISEHKRARIAQESIEIYAQIAHRLGITHIQDALELLSFPYAYPEDVAWIDDLYHSDEFKHKELVLVNLISELDLHLKNADVKPIEVYGRKKQKYSLYKKLMRKDKDINKVFDVVAARVIVKDIAACYHVLGIIHQHWRPMPGRIKDYIANPKPNGYRSLHSTVFDDAGNIIEIQIRTPEMHEEAQYGIAAHWIYKTNNPNNQSIDQSWIKKLARWKRSAEKEQKYVENFKLDVFKNRIYVFTPKGDVIELPAGATPIDFAYHIHTDIGNSCKKAFINGKPVNLNAELRNGDMIEVITNPQKTKPDAQWLKFAITRTARTSIKSSLAHKKTKLLHK